MKFNKFLFEEQKETLKEQLKNYENKTPMTSIERELLHKWVSFGNSPYNINIFQVEENLVPLDFVDALRETKHQLTGFSLLSDDDQTAYALNLMQHILDCQSEICDLEDMLANVYDIEEPFKF